jgi:hypothetical protein
MKNGVDMHWSLSSRSNVVLFHLQRLQSRFPWLIEGVEVCVYKIILSSVQYNQILLLSLSLSLSLNKSKYLSISHASTQFSLENFHEMIKERSIHCILKKLIRCVKIVDINLPSGTPAMSPLARAVEERYETIIDALLEHPDIDIMGNHIGGVKNTTLYQIMSLKASHLTEKVLKHPRFDLQQVRSLCFLFLI